MGVLPRETCGDRAPWALVSWLQQCTLFSLIPLWKKTSLVYHAGLSYRSFDDGLVNLVILPAPETLRASRSIASAGKQLYMKVCRIVCPVQTIMMLRDENKMVCEEGYIELTMTMLYKSMDLDQ